MYETELVKEAGLTDGEAKVYLALLELGSSTTGPIIDRSGVARSFIYNIIEKLLEKGLISYTVKENIKHYNASDPKRILDYIEKRKQELEQNAMNLSKVLPKLAALRESSPIFDIQVYEGIKGMETAFEQYHKRLKKGDETLGFAVLANQEPRYHDYWDKDHKQRAKEGIKSRLLFNKNTPISVLGDRNSFKLCDARYMSTDLDTPTWIFIYKDVTQIFLQDPKKPAVVEIINQEIADSFKGYFEEFWKRSKSFK